MFTLIYTTAIITYCKKKKKKKELKDVISRLSTYESNLDTFILCNSIQQKDGIGPQDFALLRARPQIRSYLQLNKNEPTVLYM